VALVAAAAATNTWRDINLSCMWVTALALTTCAYYKVV